MADLNVAIPKLLVAAKDALQNNDPKHQAEASSAAEKARLALDALDSSISPPSGAVVESCEKQFNDLHKPLDEAAKKGDGKKVLETAKKMTVEAEKIVIAAYDLAEGANTDTGMPRLSQHGSHNGSIAVG